MIKTFDDDTELMIVSDHGAKSLRGTFCINGWLIENGYLKLKTEVHEKNRFNPINVDWDKTMAWGDGGYYGKIYFNIKGREASGCISQNDVEPLKMELENEIKNLIDPEGNIVKSEVYDPIKVYQEITNCPPDLFILVGNLDWRVTNSVGNDALFLYENTNIDNANHDMNGIFIHSKHPKNSLRYKEKTEIDLKSIKKYSIIDIAPTALCRLNIEIPEDMFGKNII